MDIITIETSINPQKTKYLEDTWKRYKIAGNVLGRGLAWNGFVTKVKILKNYINNCESDIVLFTDSRDVVFADRDIEILNLFLSTDSKILFGAETNLYPNKNLIHGDSTKKYRYLNSGLFIGYTSYLKDLFNSLDIHDAMDDQEALQEKYIQGFPITLDTDCLIFQNLWDENGGRSCNFDLLYQPRYIENLRTNTRPKIFHAPGPTTVLSQAYKVAMRLY